MDKQTELANNEVYDGVRQYYGQTLQSSSDLKTDACCTPGSAPEHIKNILPLIADEVKDKYYGCGSPIPLCLEGRTVLDLGSGTGRDCFIMSKLVGPQGMVFGMDMTDKQIEIALKYIDEHTRCFGYSKPNVDFIHDYLENISEHFDNGSVDVVTSNCVINLTEDKEVILKQVYDVLKWGGEMYFADIYADRRVPGHIYKDPVLRGECLGGALYYKDFERIARRAGFIDPRIITQRPVNTSNPKIQKLVGPVKFYSVTYRLWKIEDLEDACEDYGHTAVYKGGIDSAEHSFALDNGHIFERNKPERVCGNTALMLSATRFGPYFNVSGSFSEHFGAFANCGSIGKTAGSPAVELLLLIILQKGF